jgi:4'-phosphopantetheinyl transferase EntD
VSRPGHAQLGGIAALLPASVVVVLGDDELASQPLHPEEEACTQDMGAARRREFALGRACARAALARLDLAGPVLRQRRAPVWPAGAVGSLTHCEGFCAAAVARVDDLRSLGIDAELDAPLSRRAGERICTDDERRHLDSLPPLPSGQWEKLVFSAKEAFYKAWFPLGRRFLGFHDAALHFDPAEGAFRVRVLRDDVEGPREAHGRYALAPPHVLTAVVFPRDVGSALDPGPGAARGRR